MSNSNIPLPQVVNAGYTRIGKSAVYGMNSGLKSIEDMFKYKHKKTDYDRYRFLLNFHGNQDLPSIASTTIGGQELQVAEVVQAFAHYAEQMPAGVPITLACKVCHAGDSKFQIELIKELKRFEWKRPIVITGVANTSRLISHNPQTRRFKHFGGGAHQTVLIAANGWTSRNRLSDPTDRSTIDKHDPLFCSSSVCQNIRRLSDPSADKKATSLTNLAVLYAKGRPITEAQKAEIINCLDALVDAVDQATVDILRNIEASPPQDFSWAKNTSNVVAHDELCKKNGSLSNLANFRHYLKMGGDAMFDASTPKKQKIKIHNFLKLFTPESRSNYAYAIMQHGGLYPENLTSFSSIQKTNRISKILSRKTNALNALGYTAFHRAKAEHYQKVGWDTHVEKLSKYGDRRALTAIAMASGEENSLVSAENQQPFAAQIMYELARQDNVFWAYDLAEKIGNVDIQAADLQNLGLVFSHLEDMTDGGETFDGQSAVDRDQLTEAYQELPEQFRMLAISMEKKHSSRERQTIVENLPQPAVEPNGLSSLAESKAIRKAFKYSLPKAKKLTGRRTSPAKIGQSSLSNNFFRQAQGGTENKYSQKIIGAGTSEKSGSILKGLGYSLLALFDLVITIFTVFVGKPFPIYRAMFSSSKEVSSELSEPLLEGKRPPAEEFLSNSAANRNGSVKNRQAGRDSFPPVKPGYR